jgi:hypothetical protein
MPIRLTARIGLCFVVIAGSASPALADTTLVYKTTAGAGGSMQAVLIGHGKLRIDADAATSAIVDPAASEMIILEHKNKSFIRLGRAEMEQLLGMMKQVEQMMANMPPEVREQMKAAMGGGAGVSVVKTGRTDTIGGRACVVSETRMKDEVIGETCDAPLSSLGLPESDLGTLAKASRMVQDMTSKLAAGMADMVKRLAMPSDMLPLRSTVIQNGQRNSSELVAIERTALSADQFSVPTGYKQRTIDIPKIGK